MKHLLLLIAIIAPLSAQTVVPDSFTVQPGAPPSILALIEASYLSEADADGNNRISIPEALDWLTRRRQNVFNYFMVDGAVRAETSDRTLLPQNYQDALEALDAAKAAVAAQRELICPGCNWPPL